jgi:hypothetical protein
MQDRFADTEKFSVVLSFAQALEQEARDFLSESAPSIPAYNQLNPPGSPCGGGIPDAYLFDHTGKLVQHGHPANLYALVPKLVEAAPDPIPPGILGAFEPVLFEKEARALEDPSRCAGEIVKTLEEAAAGDGGRAREARALVEQVRTWLPTEVERLQKSSRKRPGTTAFSADRFLTRFAGVDRSLEKQVESLLKQLSKDPDIRSFVRGMEDLERARACEKEAKARRFARRGRKLMERIIQSARASAELKKEAAEALASCE